MTFWLRQGARLGCAYHATTTVSGITTSSSRLAMYAASPKNLAARISLPYIGIDIDEEMLDWCRRNFDSERFEFHRSSDVSKVYNVPGINSLAYALPIADGSIDFVFSTSLCTHLLEPELINYYEESFRVLKPGGFMAMYNG